jgi:hypothetical protein
LIWMIDRVQVEIDCLRGILDITRVIETSGLTADAILEYRVHLPLAGTSCGRLADGIV